MSIVTAHCGNNADLIAAAAALYIADGAIVADVTFGKGTFWRKVDTTRFTLLASDLQGGQDFRTIAERHPANSLDVVVLDPPYVHNPGAHMADARYRNAATTSGMYHADIIDLYTEGMQAAADVLKKSGGQLWVKCKDEVEGGIQRWSHIELHAIATRLGFYSRDLFVVVPSSKMSHRRWTRQFHARKIHSFLWIFERNDRLMKASAYSRRRRTL